MKINQAAVAGTLESGDVMIRIAPLDTDDKGALDCILRARLEALLARASGIPALPWEDCQ